MTLFVTSIIVRKPHRCDMGHIRWMLSTIILATFCLSKL